MEGGTSFLLHFLLLPCIILSLVCSNCCINSVLIPSVLSPFQKSCHRCSHIVVVSASLLSAHLVAGTSLSLVHRSCCGVHRSCRPCDGVLVGASVFSRCVGVVLGPSVLLWIASPLVCVHRYSRGCIGIVVRASVLFVGASLVSRVHQSCHGCIVVVVGALVLLSGIVVIESLVLSW